MLKFLRSHAMEDEADGNTGIEKEHIIWVQLHSVNELTQANNAIKQEQVSIKIEKTENNFVSGVIRIRKTTDKDNNVEYTLTIKQEHEAGKTETSVPCTEDMYVQLSGLANEKIVKHRYEFPIEGTDQKWEVDAAPNGKGSYHRWVRIELEVDDLDKPLPELPFPTDEVILPNGIGELTKEEFQERSQELFDTYFVTKGPLVKYVNKQPVPIENVESESEGDEDNTTDDEAPTNGEEDEAEDLK